MGSRPSNTARCRFAICPEWSGPLAASEWHPAPCDACGYRSLMELANMIRGCGPVKEAAVQAYMFKMGQTEEAFHLIAQPRRPRHSGVHDIDQFSFRSASSRLLTVRSG